MRKQIIAASLLIMIGSAFAMTASEAKQDWLSKKQASIQAQADYRTARLDYAANNTPENNQAVIDTGKASLNAALDEAAAWLVWKNLEASENPLVPDSIKESISSDVEINLVTITDLRAEVDAVDNRFEMGVVFLRMVGKYFELLADVARNSGSMWVYVMENKLATISAYEASLREIAVNNSAAIELLDSAKSLIDSASDNINNAADEYASISIPGTPLIDFANGNSYLRIAQGNLISAVGYIRQAYRLVVAQ